jgi:hypothetical protein
VPDYNDMQASGSKARLKGREVGTDETAENDEGGDEGTGEADAVDAALPKLEARAVEKDIDFSAILKMVGHPEVIKLYMFLLERYATLDSSTLHAITKFLHKICSELRLEPMLYQVRALCVYLERIYCSSFLHRLRAHFQGSHSQLVEDVARITDVIVPYAVMPCGDLQLLRSCNSILCTGLSKANSEEA